MKFQNILFLCLSGIILNSVQIGCVVAGSISKLDDSREEVKKLANEEKY